MQIALPNIDDIIKANNLPEITNPVYIEGSDTPTEDGLFSYKLFGHPGGQRRKFQCGWINLGRPFLHPLAYIQMCKLNSKIPDILYGRKKFVIGRTGELIEDENNGETGLDFLYKNYEKINLDDRGTKSRKKRISLFNSYPKNVIFCTKWITIPPFYYDINLKSGSGARSIDEIGSMYIKLISLSRMLKTEGSFFTAYTTEANIQLTLVEIYNSYINKISKKQGIIHKDILGKNIDYTTRGVISCTTMRNTNKYKDAEVPFNHVGVPLYMLCTLFMPFVVAEMEAAIQNFNYSTIYVNNGHGAPLIEEDVAQLNSTHFEKIIKFYAKSPENRSLPFVCRTADGQNVFDLEFKEKLGRPFTITDFLYICTYRAIQNKFCVFVRFPLEDYRNVCSMRPVIVTTEKTIPSLRLFDIEYKNYPDLESKPLKWIDSIHINTVYLDKYGADFDGDTMSLKGIFSSEANEELAKTTMHPLNLLGPDGKYSRTIQKEGILTLYNLTK